MKAFSTAQNHVDVYAVGTDRMLYRTHLNTTSGLTWLAGRRRGGPVLGTPTVASWGGGRQDLFVRRDDKALWTKVLLNGAWLPSQTDFWPHGGSTVASPAAASYKSNWLTLVATGAEDSGPNQGVLYQGYFGASQWSPSNTTYHKMGGLPVGSATLLSIPGSVINMYSTASNFTPHISNYWENGQQPFGWTAFASLGATISW